MHLENTKVKCVTLSCGEKIWRNTETWDFIGFDIPLLSNPTVRNCPMFEGLLERFFSGDLHGLFQRKKFYGSEKHAAYYGAGPRIHITDFFAASLRELTQSLKKRKREREENIKCAGFAFGSKTKTDKQEIKSILTFTLSGIYNYTHYINHAIVYIYMLYRYLPTIINHYSRWINQICHFQACLILCALTGVSLALHYLHQRGFMAMIQLGETTVNHTAVTFSMVHAIFFHMVTLANHHSVSSSGDGDELKICGELLFMSSQPSQIFWPLWSGHAPGHVVLAVAAAVAVVAVDVAAATAVAFAFCCFDLADSVETWMLCTLEAFGLTDFSQLCLLSSRFRIPEALYSTLFCYSRNCTASSVSKKRCTFMAVTKRLTMQTRWGIVYRDLHPENVLITHDGNIKLCDLALVTWFGIFDMFGLVESHWCFWAI